MPEDLKEVLDKTKDATELRPFFDGLEKVAEHSTSVAKNVDTVKQELATKIERGFQDQEVKFNAAIENVLERQERMRDGLMTYRRTESLIGPAINEGQLNEVVSKEYKDRSTAFEHAAAQMPAGSLMSKAAVHMAVQEWWTAATRSQIPRLYSSSQISAYRERSEKLYQALMDYSHGPNGAERVKAALGEITGGGASNLVPTIVEAEVLRMVKDAGLIWPRCRPFPMSSLTHKVPSEATAVTVNWIEEAGTLTQGEPVFSAVTLIAEKLAGRGTLSFEVVQDSAPGLLPYLLSVFSEKIAGELDFQAVLGDGSGPQITGIMNGSGINAITSGTAAGRNLTWPLLVQTFAGAGETAARVGGVWIVSKQGYIQILSLVDNNNQPIVHFGTATQDAPAGTLLGRPIIVSNRLGGNATLDDVTNTNTKIVFGDPRYWIAGTRQGLQWDVTDQVNWAKHQIDCRLIGRFAGAPAVPSAWTYLGQVNYTP